MNIEANEQITSLPSKYMQIKKDILDKLDLDDSEESMLLSERELCRVYGVSRPTVRKALEELFNEGILMRDKINGVCIRRHSAMSPSSPRSVREIVLLQQSAGTDNWMGVIHEGIEKTLSEGNYYCVTLTGSKYLSYNFSNTAGIICLHSATDLEGVWKKAKNMPVVTLNYEANAKKENLIDSVMVDNTWSSYNAVKYLLSLNHKKIACITGAIRHKDSDDTAIKRLEGYKHALREAKIEIKDNLIKDGRWTIEEGYEKTGELLTQKNRPTAIFCCNDHMAIGAARAVVEMGLKIPKDVSLVGFDDIDTVGKLNPPLTTVNSLRKEIGQTAARLIQERLVNPGIKNRKVVFRGALVIRESCRPV